MTATERCARHGVRALISARRGFLAAWGALLVAAVVLTILDPAHLPVVRCAVALPPLVRWAARQPVPEPYDWPVWWYRMRLAVAARLKQRRQRAS